jgi:hypothetical protein
LLAESRAIFPWVQLLATVAMCLLSCCRAL